MRKKSYYKPYGGRRGNLWAIVLVALAAVCVTGFIALQVFISNNAKTTVEGQPEIMVILGCQMRESGPSMSLQDRLDTALMYLEENSVEKIVVSGGQGRDEPCSEARGMADYLIAAGVSEEQIYLEENSHSTAENLDLTYDLLVELGEDPNQEILVVSSGFHLGRVRLLWSRVWGSDENLSLLAAPVSYKPAAVSAFFREPLAVVKSYLLDR